LTLGRGLTRIESYAFQNCDQIKNIVTLPEALESIGSYAFSSCFSIPSLTIPSSVKTIEFRAFEYCMGLTEVCYFGTSDPGKSVMSFGECSKLQAIRVPSNYADNTLCGFPVSKTEKCSITPPEPEPPSSSTTTSTSTSTSTTTSTSSSTGSTGSPSQSEPASTHQTSEVLSGAELSSQPIGWLVKILTLLLSAAIIAF